jgi:hypothetical protein
MKNLKPLLIIVVIVICAFFVLKSYQPHNAAQSFDKDLRVGQKRSQLSASSEQVKIEVNSAIQQLVSLLTQIGPNNIAALVCTDDVSECKASQVESNGALGWYLWALAELDPQFATPDHANQVQQAFNKMVEADITPPLVTLNGVLSAAEKYRNPNYLGYAYLQLSKQAFDFGDNDITLTSAILSGMIGLQHARGAYILSQESNYKTLMDNLSNSNSDASKKRKAEKSFEANMELVKKLAKKVFDRLYAVGTGLVEMPPLVKKEEPKKGSYLAALMSMHNGKQTYAEAISSLGDGKETPHSRCWSILIGANILKYDASSDLITKMDNLINGINIDLAKEVKDSIIPSYYLPCLDGLNALAKNQNKAKLKSIGNVEALRTMLASKVVLPSLDLKEYPVCYGVGGVLNSYNRNNNAKCAEQMVTIADSAHALIGLLPFKNQTISID